MQCIVDLGPLYESPVFDLEEAVIPVPIAGFITHEPQHYYADRVGLRFPAADKTLVRRLGELNWLRFLRIQAERDRNVDQENVDVSEENVQEARTIVESKFNDSGLGTSVAPTSKYAETVVSFYQTDGSCVRVPPLSQDAKAGKPFECISCGRTIRVTRTALWKYVDRLEYFPGIADAT